MTYDLASRALWIASMIVAAVVSDPQPHTIAVPVWFASVTSMVVLFVLNIRREMRVMK